MLIVYYYRAGRCSSRLGLPLAASKCLSSGVENDSNRRLIYHITDISQNGIEAGPGLRFTMF